MESSSLLKLLSIIVVMRCSLAEEVCLQKGPCKCVFPNGTGIDLTPTMQDKLFQARGYRESFSNNLTSIELKDYYYFPCIDVNPNSTINGTCNTNLSLYRIVTTMSAQPSNESLYMKGSKQCDKVGLSSKSVFANSGTALVFSIGPSTTKVLLICAETKNTLQVYSLEEEQNVVLSFYSPHACLRQIEDVGRSLGSTLLIILFSLVIFYLTLGVLTRKFLMGATGLEVIPNLNFWMDLPNLVKDGWAFARNGFKLPNRGVGPTTSPDPNSYDSI